MNDTQLLVSHLIEKMKNLIRKIVGKSSGGQFKFYLDMMYGILKSKSIVLNDVAYSLNEKKSIQLVIDTLLNK